MKIPIDNKVPIGGEAGAVHVQAATPPLPVRANVVRYPTTSTPGSAGHPCGYAQASHGSTVSIRWRTARGGDVTL